MVKFGAKILGLTLLFEGGLMAEQSREHPSNDWMTIKDEQAGLMVDFPRQPLEMTFDIPFQNTPETGKVHLYSVPMKSGVLILSTLTSPQIHSGWLNKEELMRYFENTLVPHLFYNPRIFKDDQNFNYTEHPESATFQITYLDHDIVKRMEGIAVAKDNILYTYFYLASDKNFDDSLLKHFVDSVHFLGTVK